MGLRDADAPVLGVKGCKVLEGYMPDRFQVAGCCRYAFGLDLENLLMT